MKGRIPPSVLTKYHLLASVSHGNAMIRAAPCNTFDVLLTIVALTASSARMNMVVGTMHANPVAEIDIGSPKLSLKLSIVPIAVFRAFLNSSVVGLSGSTAVLVSLLSCEPDDPETWASLKKDTPSSLLNPAVSPL